MKKIGLIIHSLRIGGMERVMSHLANNFAKKDDIEVHMILIGIKREIVYEIPNSVIIHKPGFEFDNSSRKMDTLRTMRFLRKKVQEIDPDTVLSFGEYWNNLVLLSLYGLSYPVFISDRSEPDKDLGKFQNFLRDRLYPKAAGYIGQTEEAKKVCLTKRWNDNVRVIPNPVREIHSNRQVEKENIVLSVGRLIPTKHYDQLIRMFVEIRKPDWKLVIVGGNAKKMRLTRELNKLIHELGAEDFIFLEGYQNDVESYYLKSKVFAFTSSSEGFPNVIGEALSAGLPVVSYDCVAGPADMIEDGKNGFLVELFEKEYFKKKLGKLMDNEHLRKKMSKNAKSSVEKFKVKLIANRFFDFIISNNQSSQ